MAKKDISINILKHKKALICTIVFHKITLGVPILVGAWDNQSTGIDLWFKQFTYPSVQKNQPVHNLQVNEH
jgi:hypothetical protein